MIDELLKVVNVIGVRVALSIISQLLRVVSVFAVGLSAVYVVGRELDILRSNRSRNAFCLVIMLIVGFIETWLFWNNTVVMMVWESLLVMLLANIPYVLYGFKLYDRMDNWQDRKFANDEIKKNKRRK